VKSGEKLKEELLEGLEEVVRVRNSPQELYQFIKERVSEAGKRDVARKPSEVFSRDMVVITDRGKVEGFFVNLKTVKYLPPEVQAFFFAMMDALGCKFLTK